MDDELRALVAEVWEREQEARLALRERVTDDYRPRREINQRTLRNESGSIMASLDRGESFVLTRDGVAVGELTPVARRRFVVADLAVAAFATGPIRHGTPAGDRPDHGLLDTPAVAALGTTDPMSLPRMVAVSAITMAELAARAHATDERAQRQEILQRAEATFDPLPFSAPAARAFGRMAAAQPAASAVPLDRLLVAAIGAAARLPVCTTDPGAYLGLVETRWLAPQPE